MKNSDEIYSLPIMHRYFFIILLCMIVGILIYWQDILPLRHELVLGGQQEKKLTQQLQKLYYQELLLEEKMSEMPMTKMNLMEWQKKFIKQVDINKLLKEIIAISKRDKLQITLFNSGFIIQKNNHYMKQPFKMVVTGHYAEIARFIEQIANLPWTVVIGNFSLSKISADETYSTEMELSVYYLAK